MCVCVLACVTLPLAAFSVSQLCWGLSTQNCSQNLLPGFTKQEVDCFVSQGEPPRLRYRCLLRVWLWNHYLVQTISVPVGSLRKEQDTVQFYWNHEPLQCQNPFEEEKGKQCDISRSIYNCSYSGHHLIVSSGDLSTCLFSAYYRCINKRREQTANMCRSIQNSYPSYWYLLAKPLQP